jgi:hypothetical protein
MKKTQENIEKMLAQILDVVLQYSMKAENINKAKQQEIKRTAENIIEKQKAGDFLGVQKEVLKFYSPNKNNRSVDGL